MGSKRDNADVDGSVGEPSNKRRRDHPPSKPKIPEAKTDATYGQRSVFPSLDHPTYPSDDDLEFEDESDALAYLKTVRQEASGIPRLLVAPKAGPQLPPHLAGVDRSIYDDGVGDSRGYYHDGAYTAAPDTEPSEDSECEDGEWDPAKEAATVEQSLRRAYFANLITQFEALRARLHDEPPAELVAALDGDHGIEVGGFGPRNRTFNIWDHRIRHTDPLPVQIAAMDRRNALKLLRVILGGKFIRRGYELRERTSRWIWALLARLPDRGEMDYAEIGWIRELGKRAVLMMVSMAHMEVLEDAVDDLQGEEIEPDVEGEAFLGEVEVNNGDEIDVQVPPHDAGNSTTKSPTDAVPQPATSPGTDDGEIDMDLDDGEVSDVSSGPRDIQADIAAAKARLLERLEEPVTMDILAESNDNGQTAPDNHKQGPDVDDRARINARATLNMILTVAGEFYGQRDLLEFRDPFPAL
ncbi:hypothetical protein QBC34DRAFT_395331 [Podospora aff. communis PSN243]|uniref:Uncharacterized protein n=1 Tax=Podospora aff. communis PSN243 TaxID=3040156 RepID=A0AAV9H355_9PEZI|nr:hypothetical protein QBC34DRAFT_395331 [Podospora aff. communis PSN243]